jgi:heme oxygenase (mycobilin-producing)
MLVGVLSRLLVLTRFVLDDATAEAAFVADAHTALATLSARPGYLGGRLARALDEPSHWSLITEWESVGAYRRALSAYDVKMHATPLLARSVDEPSAYEVLAEMDSAGTLRTGTSDRAGPSDRRGPSDPAGPSERG